MDIMETRQKVRGDGAKHRLGDELLICPKCCIRTYVQLTKCDICGSLMVAVVAE